MRPIGKLLFAVIALAGAAFVNTARAEDISSADQQTIKSMISHQIEAFQRDDGTTAYGFASPTIKSYFPTVELFMNMVRNGYPPVFRPQSVTFGQLADSPYGPLQKVFLVGPDGKDYVALYSLQRQPDGTWKINGCTLVEDKGLSI